METIIWIVGIIIVLWFLSYGWDSSYLDMKDRVDREADEQARIYEEERQKEAEEDRQARIREALTKAKYALIDHPRYGTVTWVGRGRKPKWLVDYLSDGGSLSELEYPKRRVIDSESFTIRVNEKLEEGNAPQGNFAHKKIKDVRGNLWFDPDGTLYDYDGIHLVPLEVLLALSAEGFNTERMEDDHVNADG